jgi:hypothetical protein
VNASGRIISGLTGFREPKPEENQIFDQTVFLYLYATIEYISGLVMRYWNNNSWRCGAAHIAGSGSLSFRRNAPGFYAESIRKGLSATPPMASHRIPAGFILEPGAPNLRPFLACIVFIISRDVLLQMEEYQ